MEIVRIDELGPTPPAPLLDIRDVGGGRFLVSISIDDSETTYLDGPYPTADGAEREGIAIAKDQGVTTLYILHTKG